MSERIAVLSGSTMVYRHWRRHHRKKNEYEATFEVKSTKDIEGAVSGLKGYVLAGPWSQDKKVCKAKEYLDYKTVTRLGAYD